MAAIAAMGFPSGGWQDEKRKHKIYASKILLATFSNRRTHPIYPKAFREEEASVDTNNQLPQQMPYTQKTTTLMSCLSVKNAALTVGINLGGLYNAFPLGFTYKLKSHLLVYTKVLLQTLDKPVLGYFLLTGFLESGFYNSFNLVNIVMQSFAMQILV